jgi:hypothetical protein
MWSARAMALVHAKAEFHFSPLEAEGEKTLYHLRPFRLKSLEDKPIDAASLVASR